MKKWECGVCGYVHEGEEAPEKCPICDAPQKMFSEITAPETSDGENAPAEQQAEPAATPASSDAVTAKWECGVCGYIHEGAEAPDKCPICEAPQKMFSEVAAAAPAAATAAPPKEEAPVLQPATTAAESVGTDESKWECGVCGYVHTGEAAPMTCPICEAPQKMFSQISTATTQAAAPDAGSERADAPAATISSTETSSAGSAEKKWRCTVCGYIHEGSEPPEKCPICHAPAAMFEEVVDGVAETADPAEKRWRCTVCGYVHQGAEPPEKCPVCAADKKMFVEVDANNKPLGELPSFGPIPKASPQSGPAAGAAAAVATTPGKKNMLMELILKFHLHPITVHFPNGIIPAAVVFLATFLLFGVESLEKAAFFNNIFVLTMLPFVIVTGVVEWQKRYKGIKTAVFIIKIICAILVLGAANVLVFWRVIDPAVAAVDSPSRYIYFGIAAAMLAAAGIAGHLGGNLVFKARGH